MNTVYSFVVARNRDLDWRPLLVPDVLAESKQAFSLVLETGARHPAPVTVTRWLDHSSAPWTLGYRSIPAQARLIGKDGDDQLLDRFGRPLFLVEGVALPGGPPLNEEAARSLLDQHHDSARQIFREFWGQDDEAVAPRVSYPEPYQRPSDGPMDATYRGGGAETTGAVANSATDGVRALWINGGRVAILIGVLLLTYLALRRRLGHRLFLG